MPYVSFLMGLKSTHTQLCPLNCSCKLPSCDSCFARLSLHLGVRVDADSQWTCQMDQVQQLIDKLECKVGQQMKMVPFRWEIQRSGYCWDACFWDKIQPTLTSSPFPPSHDYFLICPGFPYFNSGDSDCKIIWLWSHKHLTSSLSRELNIRKPNIL